jgi:hypothetical protein
MVRTDLLAKASFCVVPAFGLGGQLKGKLDLVGNKNSECGVSSRRRAKQNMLCEGLAKELTAVVTQIVFS